MCAIYIIMNKMHNAQRMQVKLLMFMHKSTFNGCALNWVQIFIANISRCLFHSNRAIARQNATSVRDNILPELRLSEESCRNNIVCWNLAWILIACD